MTKKILVGILCIDRDSQYLEELLKIIDENKSANYKYILDVCLITRTSDKKTIKIMQKTQHELLLYDHYEIKGRHNIEHIANKRNKIISYARKNKYHALLFLDADIVPHKGFIDELLDLKSDIAVALYPVRWFYNLPCCLTDKGFKIMNQIQDDDKIIVAGFGCCLIKNKCFNVKAEQLRKEEGEFYLEGEDFGWFKNANKKGYIVKALKKPVRHII